MLRKNDLISLTITDITNEASGVGRYEGIAVFVPGSAVGDQLKVRIVKVLKNYAYGIIETILKPSADRTEDVCPVSRQCGGCSLRHISYAAECRIKQNWVTEHFRRIGKIDLAPLPIQPSPAQNAYRNKAQYPVRLGPDGKIQIGFFAPRSHRVIENCFCDLQPPFFGEVLTLIQDFLEQYRISVYDEQSHQGLVRHLFLRWGEKTGEVMVCLVINGQQLPYADALIEKLKADIPEVMFETETDNFVRDYESRMRMQGLDLETYFKYTGMTADSLREQLRPQAEKQVKLRLALEKIAKLEKIKVGKKDIDEEIQRIAAAYQMEADQVRDMIPEDSIVEDLKVKKAMDLVKEKAVIKA